MEMAGWLAGCGMDGWVCCGEVELVARRHAGLATVAAGDGEEGVREKRDMPGSFWEIGRASCRERVS